MIKIIITYWFLKYFELVFFFEMTFIFLDNTLSFHFAFFANLVTEPLNSEYPRNELQEPKYQFQECYNTNPCKQS